ncbi:hypothetical protein Ae201684_004169 [Aphanomyces euteiches]|uniref:RxLR effector protein n=1 Tax=Aphanomyces euteiches TaxID=100861 RepID=A0A6G0XJN6_9STRA|nr:hypothetical protein Ae201684_004169 [Aphanomyces euteiches]
MRLVLALMLALVALAVGAPQVLETIKEHPFDGQKRVTLRDHLKIPMSPPASPRQGFQNLRRGTQLLNDVLLQKENSLAAEK